MSSSSMSAGKVPLRMVFVLGQQRFTCNRHALMRMLHALRWPSTTS